MLNQFTEEYRNIMLAAEQRAKQFGYKEILPEDVLIQVSKIQSGNIYDLFGSFGINDAILIDLFILTLFNEYPKKDPTCFKTSNYLTFRSGTNAFVSR